MKDIEQNYKEFNTDNLLTLMNIYLTEWCHRDELLWKQVYTYFYATLVVLFLPNFTSFLGFHLPLFPSIIFPRIALVMSIVFLYVSIGYTKRLAAIGNTYQKLIDYLPPDLRRIRVSEITKKHKRLFTMRMSEVLCILMFGSLFVMSVVMIIYYRGLISAPATP